MICTSTYKYVRTTSLARTSVHINFSFDCCCARAHTHRYIGTRKQLRAWIATHTHYDTCFQTTRRAQEHSEIVAQGTPLLLLRGLLYEVYTRTINNKKLLFSHSLSNKRVSLRMGICVWFPMTRPRPETVWDCCCTACCACLTDRQAGNKYAEAPLSCCYTAATNRWSSPLRAK